MKIILAGAEYVGTTTFANAINDWKLRTMGEGFPIIHDHFKLPHTSGHPDDTTPEEQQQILAMTPKLLEMYTRYSIYYHIMHYQQPDDLTVGLHIEEAVYASLYFNYGHPEEFFSRETMPGRVEEAIKLMTDDPVVVVHMTAKPDVIRQRMRKGPHENAVLQEQDIELVLEKFEQGVAKSNLGPKLRIDTSDDSVEDCVKIFASQIEPHLTTHDRERIALHQGRQLQEL